MASDCLGKAKADVLTDVPRISQDLREAVRIACALAGASRPDLPSFKSVGEIKQFCVGLLDPGSPHPLREWFERLGTDQRYSFGHSLFLFRKTLPSGDRQGTLSQYVATMTTPSVDVDEGFLDFIDQEVPKIFRRGWDRGYRKVVSRTTLSPSAVLEKSRQDGGGRATLVDSALSHDILPFALGLRKFRCDRRAKVLAVRDGCKWRVVTKSSVRQSALKPLHHLLYDHLSNQPWLLRGDAKSSSFPFRYDPSKEIVSADYESATDFIPLPLYRHLLLRVAVTSVDVPHGVWDLAFAESQKEFVDSKGRPLGTQARGQLMGSFLSFPFLCLLNHLALLYYLGDVPHRVNGDDLVFQAKRGSWSGWAEGVTSCGLKLSKGKTMVHDSIFTLNSTLFKARRDHVSSIPFLRSKAFFSVPDSPSAAVGQYGSCVVGKPGSTIRADVQASFLQRNRRLFLSTQRALTRDLGMRVSTRVLRVSGLFAREQFYLDTPVPPPLPLAGSPVLPSGFERRPLPKRRTQKKRARVEEATFFRYLLESCWLCAAAPTPVDAWQGVRDGTYRYVRLCVKPGLLGLLVRLKSRRVNKCWSGVKERSLVWQCRRNLSDGVSFQRGGVEGGV